MLCTVTPDTADTDKPIDELNAGLRKLAQEQGIKLAEIHDALAPVWYKANRGDGLHPNSYGNARIADVVQSALPKIKHGVAAMPAILSLLLSE